MYLSTDVEMNTITVILLREISAFVFRENDWEICSGDMIICILRLGVLKCF